MVIIYDISTKEVAENFGTNSAFPDGNIPNIFCEDNQEILKIHDNSDFAKKIIAETRKFKLNDDLKDIIITETEEETLAKEKEKQRQEILNELSKLDVQIPRIVEDLIDFVGFVPHQNKKYSIDRKKELRQQLNNL